MEKKTQNRDLYINIQEKRRNCLQKTACTLIVFIFILLPSIQFSLNRVIRDDVRNSSISLLFQKAIADQWSLKTDAYSYLKGPGWDILAGFSFEYSPVNGLRTGSEYVDSKKLDKIIENLK